MSNESKPQGWFYLQDETWNGPFKTSGLKELVRKGLVDPNTLLRIGIAGVPIKAHQVKSLFPNYQGEEQAAAISIKNKGIPNNAPALIAGALILVFVLGILFFGLTQSDNNMTTDSGQNGFKGASENPPKSGSQMQSKNVFQVSLAEGIASIEKEMVLIPAGRFMMGDQSERLKVTLTKHFYMGKYEVTQEQWEAVMGNNPSQTKGAKLPVTNVSWKDCHEFIKKLNGITKGKYRLPTEAEWEYACRAGTTTVYSVGDSITKADANIGDVTAGSIKAVGSYKANGFSLYDMHGNVWEWCEDWMADYPVGDVTDPKGPAMGEYRVMRGGSFYLFGSSARSSLRTYVSPSVRDIDGGFRLARAP
jgi:formylglycine-generating enzyme required for sulfatase activity